MGLLSIIDPVAFDDVISEAIDAGIPVVAIKLDVDRTPNRRLSAVCQDLYEAGRALGREAAPLTVSV
ncbi:MAG: substrate-binding domain-containing protein [Anaerolineae bacterium]|nr:substrate-binding domain-containing protein [Anaerolineae bacterium]